VTTGTPPARTGTAFLLAQLGDQRNYALFLTPGVRPGYRHLAAGD